MSTATPTLAVPRSAAYDEGDGEPFAIECDGPNLAYPLHGSKSYEGVEGALSNAFYEQEDKPPSNEALSQVMKILGFRARFRSEPRRLWTRVAQPEPARDLASGPMDVCAVLPEPLPRRTDGRRGQADGADGTPL